MNIFNSIRKYAGNWNVTNTRKFNDEEKAEIKSAVVVQSETARTEEYGLSVCFTLISGQKAFIPLSRDSHMGIGDVIDKNTVNILTLERDGKTIERIEE